MSPEQYGRDILVDYPLYRIKNRFFPQRSPEGEPMADLPSTDREVTVVFVYGANGSGKDTLVEGLVREDPDKRKAFTSGDMVRDAKLPFWRGWRSPYRKFRKELKGYLEDSHNGGYIPDDAFIPNAAQAAAELIADDSVETVFFNGVVRTDEQERAFMDVVVPSLAQDINVRTQSIHIDVPREVVVERCATRREEMVAAGLPPRPDDDPEVVGRRYDKYMGSTKRPVVDKLVARGQMVNIDGTQSKEQVRREAAAAIFGQ